MRQLVLILILVLGARSTPAWAKLQVVTTIPVLADIAKNVGGDDVDATSLIRGTEDPHFVDGSPVRDLKAADLLVRNGAGLEDGWLLPLLLRSHNEKIREGGSGQLDASSVVEIKEAPPGPLDRGQGDAHPVGNPHFLLDPRNGMKVARAIADRLGDLDPSKAAEFHKRADAYVKELEAKTQVWEASLSSWKGRPVVTYHKSWIYLLDWLGLKEAGTLEPRSGIPPSPENVVSLIRSMKAQHVKSIFIEPYYPKGTAEHVARETGAKLYVLPTEPDGLPQARTYEGVFETIVQKLQGK